MAQLPGTCSCLRQHLVAEEQQVPGDPRRGIRQKRQQIDLSVPKVMPLIRLSGEAFRRHTRVFRARGGLQDVKEIEANRLLDLHGAALCAIFPDIPDVDIAAAPDIVPVLALGGGEMIDTMVYY